MRDNPAPMGISHYIKEIGRGARGAKPLARAQAADLFGQVLDGSITDLEMGAFCLAMRIKGETPEELAGFLDATHARLARFPATERPLVVLPSYNGARRLPVLTPLLALLLAREGLPVLVHGAASGAPCGWRARAPTPGWKVCCSAATPAPKPGSRPCCRTACRPRPTAGSCCAPAPRRRPAWPRAAR